MTGAPLITDPLPAALDRTLADYPTSSAWEGQDWLGLTRYLGASAARYGATYGVPADIGLPQPTDILPPQPAVDAKTLNERYGIPGQLQFDQPAPESVAESLYAAKREDLMRQDAAQRTPGDFWSQAARLGASFAVGALDPVNVAASFMPAVGEARMAGWLGLAGEGIASRMLARGAAGAVQGAVGQAALEPLQFARASSLQEDYSGVDVLNDLAFGAALGGGLHAVAGGVADALGHRFAASPDGRLAATDPDTREAALRVATAQLADGRPVEVQPVFDATRVHDAEALRPTPEPTPGVPTATAGPVQYEVLPRGATVHYLDGGAVAGEVVGMRSTGTWDGGVMPEYRLMTPEGDFRLVRALDLAEGRQPAETAPGAVRDAQLATALRQAGGAPSPDEEAAGRLAAGAAKIETADPTALDKQIADIQRHVAALRGAPEAEAPVSEAGKAAAVTAPIAVPQAPRIDDPEVMAAQAGVRHAAVLARAWEAAAACLAGNGG